ncbi:putative E3 ubiquitin-protein ligase ARI1 [Sesamum angolense]|uniref:E3 ubiquitin-protein ligase ARI1 n=1 Tax=Sesamum angolense TaxID=2727404 RepID=A0AAE1WY53_9LAMI|nr:putative E3 ubiquitin-protein ligase ARI1 [Sesamum angolense]
MDLPEAQKSDVAPATASAYLDPNYWDRRFEQEEHYEWFKDYSHFRHLILQYIKPNSAPHFRRPFFNAAAFTWSVEWRTFGDGFHYFFYILKKRASFRAKGHQIMLNMLQSSIHPYTGIKLEMICNINGIKNFAGNLPLTDFRNRSQLLKSKTLIFSAYYLYIHALSCIESDQDKYWVMEDDYYLSGGSEEEDDYYPSDREAESLDGLENEESDAQWATSKAPSSKVITKESLLAAQREDLRRVMELLSVREHHARTLLIHYRWDVEKLIAVYVEKGKSCMFSEAGVSVIELVDLDPPILYISVQYFFHFRTGPWKNGMNTIAGSAIFLYGIVLVKYMSFDTHGWTEHFIVKINEGQSKRIRCMAHKCNAICDEEAHSPCSCLMWELWTKKCRDESETIGLLYIQSLVLSRDHTWSHIANHSCGRYKEDGEKKAERAKRDLYRYMHYHNRYKAHTDSFKQESRLRETIKEKVSHLEARDSKLRDFSWITNGLCRLFRSRRALSYSYPFAFYMFGEDLFKDEMTKKESEIKQHLFEDQQQQLEANVEKLSKFLEEPFDEYECIENDLLGSLQYTIHIIAPYQSKGIAKAEELTWSAQANSNNKCQKISDQSTGDLIEIGKASASGTSDESPQLSRKRPRKGSSTGSMFDLNLPAEVHQPNT